MRLSILVWSAASGAMVGALLAVALLAIGIIVAALVPAIGSRLEGRAGVLAATSLLVFPVIGAALGLLEGRSK